MSCAYTPPSLGSSQAGSTQGTGSIPMYIHYQDQITLQSTAATAPAPNSWVIDNSDKEGTGCDLSCGAYDPSSNNVFVFVILNSADPTSTGPVMDGDEVSLVVNAPVGCIGKGNCYLQTDSCDGQSGAGNCSFWYLGQANPDIACPDKYPAFFAGSDSHAYDQVSNWIIRSYASAQNSPTSPLTVPSTGPLSYNEEICFGMGDLTCSSGTSESYISYYHAWSHGDFNCAQWGDANPQFIAYNATMQIPYATGCGTPCNSPGAAWVCANTSGCSISGGCAVCSTSGQTPTYDPSSCTVTCAGAGSLCPPPPPPSSTCTQNTSGCNPSGVCITEGSTITWNCSTEQWVCTPPTPTSFGKYVLFGIAGAVIFFIIIALIMMFSSSSTAATAIPY